MNDPDEVPPPTVLPVRESAAAAPEQTATWTKPTADKGEQPAEGLKGYEILEVLGRGGMGVVYKARQRSLNRIVALKMVRSGAHAGEEDLKRFRIEAEAVARLQHPNIVQIYEVGETDDGPFLALEFIDGGSLAAQLDGTCWPALKAAQLVQKLAEAMHYAHQRGIVHRDLKPANILLQGSGDGAQATETKTRAAETETTKKQASLAGRFSVTHSTLAHDLRPLVPKITDFGLAKMLIEGSQGPTQTGDFLGTPCYTAPEQASGRIHEIGPGSDVYALGAILYELLTGRPPFEGATILDTLDQVRSKEPVPPTRLHRKLPRDLETICLKCLEKDPRRRYASAEYLADDLERFLIGRPIQARPVGLVERTWKLVRRHPARAMAVATVVIALIVLGIGGWLSAAAINRERLQAEEDFAGALRAVEDMLSEVGAVDLADVPQMEEVRKKLLLRAKDYFRTFLAARADKTRVRHLAGRSFRRLGDIHAMLEEHEPAENAYVEARRLLLASANSRERQEELATTLNSRGNLLKNLGHFAEAETSLREALDLRKVLAEQFPSEANVEQILAASHHDLGTVLARLPKRRDDAESEYREALRLQEKLGAAHPDDTTYGRDRARTLNNLGILLRHVRQGEAEKILREAVSIRASLVTRPGAGPAARRELAKAVNNLAGALGVPGRLSEAEAEYKRAIQLLKDLAGDFPRVPAYRQELAGAHRNYAIFLEGSERFADAESEYLKGLALRQQLAKEFRDVPDYQRGLAKVYVDFGSLREKQQLYHEADRNYRIAVEMLDKIARPECQPVYYSDLGLTQHMWGLFHGRRGQFRDLLLITALGSQSSVLPGYNRLGVLLRAQKALSDAPAVMWAAHANLKHACDADPKNAVFRSYRSKLLDDLAALELELGNHRKAAQAAHELRRLEEKTVSVQVNAAKFLARCVAQAKADSRLSDEERGRLADLYAREAVQILREARREKDLPDDVRTAPEFESIRQRQDFRQLLEDVRRNKPLNA